MAFQRFGFLFAAALAVGSFTGCGGIKTGTITGIASFDGKPLKGGMISFTLKTGEDLTPRSFNINDDGTYVATEVPFGELAVSIAPPPPPPVQDPGTPVVAGMVVTGDGRPNKDAIAAFTENGLEVPPDLLRARDQQMSATRPTDGPGFPPEYCDPLTSPLSFTLDKPAATFDVAVPATFPTSRP
jgi:hypothetical protein